MSSEKPYNSREYANSPRSTNSDVVAGVQWVAQDAANHGRTSTSVVNMSLGGSYSAVVNQAVSQAIAQGLTFIVAAGNDGTDASTSSPASVQSAITVGATDNTDTRAFYSNYGQFVDIFAPGSDIVSAWIGSSTAQHTDSGTSMATPHVTGLAAYLISLGKAAGPSNIASTLKALTRVQVSNEGPGTQAALAYNGDGQ
jgi:oryzin